MDATQLLVQYGLAGVGVILLLMLLVGKLRFEREIKPISDDRDFWRGRALHTLDLADRATTVSSAALLAPAPQQHSGSDVLDQIRADIEELKRSGKPPSGGSTRGRPR